MVPGPYLILEHKVIALKRRQILSAPGKYLKQGLMVSPNFESSTINVWVKGLDSFYHSQGLQASGSQRLSGCGTSRRQHVAHLQCHAEEGPHLKPVC